jgi:hypothetical protein
MRRFADIIDLCRLHVAAARRSALQIIAVFEFRLGPEIVLGQRLGVGLQLIGRNWLSRFPIEDVGDASLLVGE